MILATHDLNTAWFIIIAILFTGYAVLDGFDLGVGALHLFVKNDSDRRIMLNSIAPVWDGNEVWLVTGGGALFAAFPNVYATVFSGFYSALIALLVALILRAVAIEFRSKMENPGWRRLWDASFSVGSVASMFLLGVALGNIAMGVPLDQHGEYVGGFWSLLRPYPILVGVSGMAILTMHGLSYALLKTNGDLQSKLRSWVPRMVVLSAACYAALAVATFLSASHLTARFKANPWLFGILILGGIAIGNVLRETRRRREKSAFLSSCTVVIALLALFAVGMYPNLVPSRPNPEYSLTIHNASSSHKTLSLMLIIALVGMPLVLLYTIAIYRIFRGKVKLDRTSY
ncbi:MAG: cytochrome d ubiquinol oxidase subunit II [Verrucomicrobiae bacterium]|nr:cytochrome d ubiquinol oxidase subunit II [Verrucomicrobiae bacterium]